MKQIKLTTSYPCLIKTENSSMELDENESVLLENFETAVNIYPIGQGNKIAFQINTNNLSQSPFYQYHIDNENLYIFLIDGQRCLSFQSHSFSKSDTIPNIEVGDGKIIFSAYPHKKIVEFSKDYKEFSCHKNFNIIYALLKSPEKSMLIAMNTKTGKLKSFKGKQILLQKDGFSVEQNFDDIAGHNIKSDYKITKDGLRRTGHEIIYTNSVARTVSISEAVPYAFLEAIKVEDYTLALSYLSDTLQEKINPTTLKNYFGKVIFYFELEKNKFFLKTENSPKIATFEISNEKIVDIDI